MKAPTAIFDIERFDDTLLVTPTREMSESDRLQFSDELDAMLKMLGDERVKNVVIDFRRTAYFGCTGLAFFFLKLWDVTKKHGGQMAFCGLSDYEREVLKISKLDHLWPMCSSTEEALKAVRT